MRRRVPGQRQRLGRAPACGCPAARRPRRRRGRRAPLPLSPCGEGRLAQARAGWGARASSARSDRRGALRQPHGPARSLASHRPRRPSPLAPPRTRGEGVALRHQVPPQLVRLAHRRRQPDRRQPRREPVEARQAEREEVAALRGDERVQLVEDHAPQAREERARLAMGEEQRELLRRGEQDVGRALDLARALVRPACRRCGSRRGPAAPSRATGASRLRAMSTASAFSGEM